MENLIIYCQRLPVNLLHKKALTKLLIQMGNEFIHIGFSKSASTYLQSLLKDSNEVNYIYKSKRFSLNSENISSYKLSSTKINFESDEHIIMPSVHPTLKVLGTRQKDVSKIIARIKTVSFNAKIILIIRNQVGLIKSRYSQYIVGGGDYSLEDFVYDLNGFGDNNLDYYHNLYFEIIKCIEDEIGKDNLLVLLFEDVINNEQYLPSEISKFSNIKLEKKYKNILNLRKGLSLNGINNLRKLNSFLVNEKINIDGTIDVKLPEVIYKNLVRGIRLYDYFFGKEQLTIDGELRELIIAKFKDDNEKLSNYLNRDLKSLGYIY